MKLLNCASGTSVSLILNQEAKVCFVFIFLSLICLYTDTELHVFKGCSILQIRAFKVLLKPVWPTVMLYYLAFDCRPYLTSTIGDFPQYCSWFTNSFSVLSLEITLVLQWHRDAPSAISVFCFHFLATHFVIF